MRSGTIVALGIDMSAHPKSPAPSEEHDTSNAPFVLRVPCPGKAHLTGEECLICDEGDEGTIAILLTQCEVEAIGYAAQGRPVPARLSPRLHALGLLHDVAGLTAPTERGYSLLGGPLLRPN